MNKTAPYKAIFGGTFDPFHLGHLNIAKHVANTLALTEITLLPTNIPPHKSAAKVTSFHRLAMLEALAEKESLFNLDDREIRRQASSYTIETLTELKQHAPNTALNFIIGMDSLLHFTQWFQWQEIIKLTNLIVCTRPQSELTTHTQTLNKQLHPFITSINAFNLTTTSQITILPAIAIDISSTQVRQAIYSNSNAVNSYLPQTISQYIKKHQLYR